MSGWFFARLIADRPTVKEFFVPGTRAPRRRTTQNSKVGQWEQNVNESMERFVSDWARLTWVSDSQRLLLPISAWNWLILAGVLTGWVMSWASAWPLLTALTVGTFIASLARCGWVMPRRRRAMQAIFDAVQTPAKLPRGTVREPVQPERFVKVRTWGAGQRPIRYSVTVGAGSDASTVMGRIGLETMLEAAPHRYADHGGGLVFTWNASSVLVESVRASDVRLLQRNQYRRIARTVSELVQGRRRNAADALTELSITEWTQPAGDSAQSEPARIALRHAGLSSVVQDELEREFDRQVPSATSEWLFAWNLEQQMLTITGCPRESLDAQRKQQERQLRDQMADVAPRSSAAGRVTTTVQEWMPAETHLPHLPRTASVDFGSRDLGSQTAREQLLARLEPTFARQYGTAVEFVYEWSFGAATQLALTAHPANSVPAQRRAIEKRLFFVAQGKFGGSRSSDGGITVEVLDWRTVTPPGESDERSRVYAHRVRITFGSVDVTRPETRFNFAQHWDSQTTTNDWKYQWDTAAGSLETTAVPRLADYVPFPEEGSEEARQWHADFRAGKITLGPAKGGGYATIDLNDTPHTLVGGPTGAGKSVLLSLLLYGSLSNPTVVDLMVIDPKITDFSWVPGYPNVKRYGVSDIERSDEEINEIVREAYDEMRRRQTLLQTYQYENLHALREAARRGDIDLAPEDVPKRWILFFDEVAEAFTRSSNKDVKDVQEETLTMLEKIGMFGRALEVNGFYAGQKPEKKNIGTQVKSQCGNKIAVGWLDYHTSEQVLGNDLANKGMDRESSPKGRGWMVAPKQEDTLFQVFFLPQRNTPHRDDPTRIIEGLKERVKNALTQDGWTYVEVTRTYRTTDQHGNVHDVSVKSPEWVHMDNID